MDLSNQPEQEGRQHPGRVPKHGVRIICRTGTLGLGPNLAISAVDVSETGVRLITQSAMQHGQEVELEFEAPGRGRPLRVIADVIGSAPTAAGSYHIDFAFRRQLTHSELQDLT